MSNVLDNMLYRLTAGEYVSVAGELESDLKGTTGKIAFYVLKGTKEENSLEKTLMKCHIFATSPLKIPFFQSFPFAKCF